ncbi:DUF309 domain-containing protein [Geomonas sp. RF6]|uniref:DUF309 domain-containing protein n=1 Tax=Geomonas sp. RF6 TaxID=2897342 RepID=UPI001E499508|nr:DUF309 domain-containing protein [Geomonas sp. RF6]UFS69903.1 DUF309 domain-containing protein [Geomonas sp. RF6]
MECGSGSAPLELVKAIDEFNKREWFECHETLEELWVREQGELRDFYQGLLQIAVALHHWRSGNYGGVLSLLKGGAQYLQKVRQVCYGVDVVRVVDDALRLRQALSELGADRMWQVDRSLLPVITLTSPSED